MVIRASKLSGVVCESRLSNQAGEFRLFIDPVSSDSKANLTLMTKTLLPISSTLPMEVIAGPGEYEIMGVKVLGIASGKGVQGKYFRTVYLFEMDGLRLCFLGEIEKVINNDLIEGIGTVDILFIDGISNSKDTISLIKDIDPRMVVCQTKESAGFLAKEFGQVIEPTDKEIIKKKDLEAEEIKLIWLISKEK